MGNIAAELDDRLRALENELEQLAADRQRYADLFALAPEACLVTDVNGTILEANALARELLQATQLQGIAIDSFVPLEQRRMFQALAGAAIACECATRIPGSVRLANGDVPVEFSVGVVRRGRAVRLAWMLIPLQRRSLFAMAGQMPCGRNTTTASSTTP